MQNCNFKNNQYYTKSSNSLAVLRLPYMQEGVSSNSASLASDCSNLSGDQNLIIVSLTMKDNIVVRIWEGLVMFDSVCSLPTRVQRGGLRSME